MSVATLVSDGFGAFGNIARVVMLGLDAGGSVTPPSAQYSGGYVHDVEYAPRRRSVQEERERLGIIPKRVKKVIRAVAAATVQQEKTEPQADSELRRRLAQQDIQMQARYMEAMRRERDRLLTRDITRALAIRRRQQEMDDEDEEISVSMLLM